MKSNSLLALLVGALWVCGLTTLWVSVRHYFSVKELQQVQTHLITLNQTRRAIQVLAQETVACSRSNTALRPLLQQFEILPQPGTTNPPAPAAPAPQRP
jgi:aspartate oxidase